HRPRVDRDGYLALTSDPASVIPNDYLLPDTRDGPVRVRFPYSLALARLVVMPRLWARLTGRPPWAGSFQADHPSGALPLSIAIVEAFNRVAAERGEHMLVVMLPGNNSFRGHAKFGEFEYQPLSTA